MQKWKEFIQLNKCYHSFFQNEKDLIKYLFQVCHCHHSHCIVTSLIITTSITARLFYHRCLSLISQTIIQKQIRYQLQAINSKANGDDLKRQEKRGVSVYHIQWPNDDFPIIAITFLKATSILLKEAKISSSFDVYGEQLYVYQM